MPSPGVSALQAANPATSTVARANQTTVTPVAANAPFIRQSRQAQQLGFVTAGVVFGGTVTQQLSAVGGYLRALSLTVTATGGSGTSTVALQADAPWNLFQTVQFKDPTGQPIYQVDGFSLYLINLLSGMCGQGGTQNPTTDVVYSAPTTGASASGNFTLRLYIPLEFDSAAYCCLADMNAAAMPLLTLILNGSSAFYSTAPNTAAPTMQIQCNELFWTIPQANPTAAPPDIGSSTQWNVVSGGQQPTTSANLRVQHPSPGTYIHTLIAVLRDSTNARINAYPTSDLTLWVDNFPYLSTELLSERQDKIYRQVEIPIAVSDQGVATVQTTTPFSGNVKTAGVIAYSFRSSVQEEVSSADNHDLLLSTTPATKLEIGGTWGTVTNSPATLSFITGWLYPANPAAIPYTHLAA
ncbi:MAG TPA: hypothetical protein VJ741_09655 [Solirubrobacteraceae bacterium]|nr:hypothetical protein [Solirubrobacteraceae bacterium]